MAARVLIVEPNRVLGRIYHRALSAAGHTVQTCATAQSAILAADRLKPDVVVLELQLVAHSGIEFLYEFRSYADWQTVPVVVHSQVPPAQFGGEESLLRTQLSVAEYLYKPTTSLHDLLAAIDRYAPARV